jgi:hypothetical protein
MAVTRPERLLDTLNIWEKRRHPARSPDEDQRQFQRYPVRGDAELYPMSQPRITDEVVHIKLRDVGLGGLHLVSDRWLEPGSMWRVCFLMHGYAVAQQAVIIQHCRPVAEGVYYSGGQFVIDAGLMAVLGVDPNVLNSAQAPDDNTLFVPPAEAA